MRLTIIGCGDAFGAGGSLQTSFHVQAGAGGFLIDCGATTLIGMRRLGLDVNGIATVFVSHLHGDHFSKRTRPLVVTGPRGIEQRFLSVAEGLYPNITTTKRDFDLRFVEYAERTPLEAGGVTVTPFEVKHPSGAPPYALRFEIDGKVVSFTGDTGWVDVLCEVAQGSDLFITECFQYDVVLPIHLDYLTIDANYQKLGARRVLLTHMGEAMLANAGKVDRARYLIAKDGMSLDL
jgi:ribonuclease BN (tRNA processing enzyme)